MKSSSVSPPPPSYVIHRVRFQDGPEAESMRSDRSLIVEALQPVPSMSCAPSWLHRLLCCGPDGSMTDAVTDPATPLQLAEPIREWVRIGTVNQISLLSGNAHRVVFHAGNLQWLNEGLKDIPLRGEACAVRVADVMKALSELSYAKNQLPLDAAGISATTVSHLLGLVENVARALQALDRHVKRSEPDSNSRSSILATPLWTPQDGLAPGSASMDYLLDGLSRDILALKHLQARIPA